MKKKNKYIPLLIVILTLSSFLSYFIIRYYSQKEDILISENQPHSKVVEQEKEITASGEWITPDTSKSDGPKVESGTEEKVIQNTKTYDTETDGSIFQYVSSNRPFYVLAYHPTDLENLDPLYIRAKEGTKLRKEAADSLHVLAKDFYSVFKTKFTIVSAYRDFAYQQWIKDRWCSDNLCAKAGYSEHQTGLAIDMFDASSQKEFLSNTQYKKYFEWMKNNAYKYGFHNSYQKGLDIDGYDIEPWHWRYLWKDLAKELYEKNITFAQYYNNRVSKR